MVSGGYPRNIETGLEIKGTDKVDTLCLLAGARKGGNSYYTTGGRVVNVVGLEKLMMMPESRLMITLKGFFRLRLLQTRYRLVRAKEIKQT